MAVLFLDYDGVLHPEQVYRVRGQGIVLKADDHNLFEHSGILAELLEPHPRVQIVLSTSWVSVLRSFDATKRYLPKRLQERVVGATWHSTMDQWDWNRMSRYDQIAAYVVRHRLKRWVAVDDDACGWPRYKLHFLVHTRASEGLGHPAAQEILAARLSGMAA